MRHSFLITLLATFAFNFQAHAGFPADGFGQDSEGHFYVRDFTPANNGANLEAVSSQDILVAEWGADGSLRLRLDDGSLYIIKDIESLDKYDLRDFDTRGAVKNFLPAGNGGPYTFYMRPDQFFDDGNTNTAAMLLTRPGYPGPRCTGSCRRMIGNFNSVRQVEDGIILNGWVCDRLSNKSLDVRVFFGGPRDSTQGKLIKVSPANLKLWDAKALTGLCGTSTAGHRFRIKIPQKIVNAHLRQKIYIYGLSSNGITVVPHSGALTVPVARIKGRLEVMKDTVGHVHLQGWACNEGVNKPVKVRAYGGGPAGVGTFIMERLADNASSAYVSEACGTTVNHRFDLVVSKAQYDKFKGRFWVHGVSLIGGPNNAIRGSGNRFP